MKVLIGKYSKGSDRRKVNVKFDDCDFWSLDHTLALIIVPALKEFKKIKVGYPGSMDCHENGNEIKGNKLKGRKRWEKILDQMIWSFEQATNCKKYEHPFYIKKGFKAYYERMQNGFDLFAKYYGSFWY